MNREERRRARQAAHRGELSPTQLRQLAQAEQQAREEDRRQRAARAIDRAAAQVCNAEQRAILHLHYEEGLSLRKVGEKLGMHNTTVMAKRDAALELIRRHIEGAA